MKIDFRYNLRQRVFIRELNIVGTIVGFYYGETGIQYQVSYFWDGKKNTIYMFPDDITFDKSNDGFGFIKDKK